jgi:hypothetical protein
LEDKLSLISIRLQMLIDLFGKKVSDNGLEALKRVYCDALQNFTKQAISAGFSKVEKNCDRFPTPKLLAYVCQENMPSEAWRYSFSPYEDQDPETGETVSVIIDPDPTCYTCREPRSSHPSKRCKQYTKSGLGDDRVMFRPQDCPEGRAFLAKLKEISEKK